MLSKLVQEQSALQFDIERFEGNPLDFTYFMSMFQESVEKKIYDPDTSIFDACVQHMI